MKKIFSVFFSILISFSASAALAADSVTTNLGLVKPEAVAGSWGAKINTDLDIIDNKFPGGAVSHAATADALTANGTNCPGGQAPSGVDASGNVEGCFTPSAGMADPGGNGVVVRTAPNTTINRTITGTANEITLSNGDGVAGNPTISAHAALARDAEVQSGSLLVCSDGGANDTYTCTMTPTLTAYATGQVVFFKANTANTGAATLNIDSLGAKSILKQKGGALADNDMKAGQWSCLIYDGTNFELCNASPNTTAGTGATSLTITPFTAAADTTWTKPAGLLFAQFWVCGGGGGGGGSDNDAAAGGGGGGGGCASKTYAAASLGATERVLVGAGGTAGDLTGTNGTAGAQSKLGADGAEKIWGTGGGLGVGATGAGVAAGGSAGGCNLSPDICVNGATGSEGVGQTAFSISGTGGGSLFGGGGGSVANVGTQTTGKAGASCGGGGSGGASQSTTGAAGGAGKDGCVYVYEYK